jgi:hypothetical protein
LLTFQKAEAELAYELQAAKTKQRIKDEQMQIKVVERTQEILVQEQEIQRRERELDSTVRRPAEAEKFRGVIHQSLNIILQLKILVLLLVSTLPYVVKVKNYS